MVKASTADYPQPLESIRRGAPFFSAERMASPFEKQYRQISVIALLSGESFFQYPQSSATQGLFLSALIRIKGAYIATTIAEYFRDMGKDVVLMMDSVTRFAMAQREIGLTIGEPPTTKGYTPSVFAILPKLLERAGCSDKGSITGFYTVLVDGDDMTEPIADAVRSILDGHIVLSRKIANKGQFPAIDPLQSISRVMSDITTADHRKRALNFNEILSTYKEAEDLINIGAYVRGSNPQIDHALSKINLLRSFLVQDMNEKAIYSETVNRLKSIIDAPLT